MKASRLARYEAALSRMEPTSTQYQDQVNRIKAYMQNDSIALTERRR